MQSEQTIKRGAVHTALIGRAGLADRIPAGAAALLLIVVALFAATPALGATATKPYAKYAGSATLTAVGDEPYASGVATLTATLGSPIWWAYPVKGALSLSCRGLTPSASYVVTMTGFESSTTGSIASQKGTLNIQSHFEGFASWLPTSISVYRVEPGGNVLVLSGTVVWRQRR